MRLDDLKFFKRVAELGSLSAAGREFGLSPSAASSRLSNLEKELGTQLVARTTRRTGLTEAGQVFLNHAAAAVGELEQAKALIDAAEDTPRGLLRISSNVFFGRKHILPYLAEYRQLYPDVRLEVDMTDRLVDLVAEGYDMAIRGAPLPDSSLIARKLGGNPRVLCASPVYLARKGTPHRPEDLRNHDCIGFDPMPVWYFNGPDGEIAHHIEDPVISGDSGDFAYDAAIHGLGLTVKSVAHVWEDLRDGRLVAVLEDYPIARTGNIYAVYPPARFIPPKITTFVDFLLSKYGRPPYWETDHRQAARALPPGAGRDQPEPV
ncbi:LysR family transcriptional regulator [Roseibium salinum]|uniref:LysR family transcriptional regulator n=1 Tax=Roseibium salinum TaxID=1604349 RepID=A0ABT3R2L1_9HYPH|nr:LysR family transcriptional regulator [Roseibium sp. DSM 29163]MCX2723202.1 LysR family transcriptional regulator [Roseibium sp. DSM 29163]